ncbi:hypothetical protein [Streptomyces sp. NBC_01353]|uniref:hypothetical protein n=1 Tax=Streptomyces sp. NBC_01353 TaxID=2903835 RepID=UPI002E30D358|nr:hypothetical protein [Streptomyces sp. NBC_01353]
MGPRAGRRAERLRTEHPQATPAELRAMAAERGRRAVTAEGSFVGGPFIVLVPFAFCGAMLLQARTILELAGLEGRDTTAPERAAELLVLQGVYEDTAAARAALRARPTAHDSSRPRPGRIAALRDLVMRMARLLGLITPDDDRSRLARVGQWALLGVVFLIGLVAPLVWMPYLAVSFYRATTQVTDRATLFYVGSRDTRTPRPARLRPEMVAAGLRALASILVPTVSVALVLFTDMELGGARWPLIVLLLIVSPVVVGGLWLWRRHSSAHREDP